MNSIFLRDKEIAKRFSVSRTTIWRWVENNQFPNPIQFSKGCTRWKLEQVEQWEANRNNNSQT